MTFTIVNPATAQPICTVPAATEEDLDAAVARAHEAFAAWRHAPPSRRAAILRALADLVRANLGELAATESRNVGKPLGDARDEVEMAADLLDYYSSAIDKHHGQTIPVDGGWDVTFHEPLGVVGLIVPWNFPFNTAVTKIAPALACANTVVVKPSELTPLTTLRLAELAREAGVPDGVLEVVVGDGPTVGEALVRDPRVAKVAFTGSSAVATRIMALASGTLKPLSLELGGKSVNVVFDDADLDRAAEAAPMAVFGNAGQDCCARSRLLVQRGVYDRFLERFVEATAKLKVAPPEDPDAAIGPLISERHLERVRGYLDGAGDVAFQGTAPSGPGYWLAPTILAPVANDDRRAREEIFGPVASVIPFDDDAEAVRIANDSEYGLSGSIWTSNVDRALTTSRAIDTGVLSINSNSSVFVAAPFGGVKRSGFGRENGMAALDDYSYVKNVFIATGASA